MSIHEALAFPSLWGKKHYDEKENIANVFFFEEVEWENIYFSYWCYCFSKCFLNISAELFSEPVYDHNEETTLNTRSTCLIFTVKGIP